MKLSLLSRSLHKWLALFVGLQLLVWAVTGFYMVAVDLDFIHGDPLVRNLRTPVGSTKRSCRSRSSPVAIRKSRCSPCIRCRY